MTTGERIRVIRESLGMSQSELAKRMGYTHKSAINKIETNINGISHDKLEKFCIVLGVSSDYLLGINDLTEEEKEVIAAKALDLKPKDELPEDIAALNSFLRELGEEIIKVDNDYYLGELGRLTKGDMDMFRTSMTSSAATVFNILAKRHHKEMLDLINGSGE